MALSAMGDTTWERLENGTMVNDDGEVHTGDADIDAFIAELMGYDASG